jgi:hypothetical protein
MTKRHPWTREPLLWDDHGQSLCDTQEEEDRLYEELLRDGIIGPDAEPEPPGPAGLDPNPF